MKGGYLPCRLFYSCARVYINELMQKIGTIAKEFHSTSTVLHITQKMYKTLAIAIVLVGLVYVATATVPTCHQLDPNSKPEYFEDDEDCGAYYECSNGVPLHFLCPPGLYYNSSLGCAWPDRVNCGTRPITTTVGPTTDEPDTTEPFYEDFV